MKSHTVTLHHLLFVIITLSVFSQLEAQNSGIWINATTNSTWTNAANWSGSTIADGVDAIADFSTLDIAANRTVNLGSSRSIGTLIFGDATTPTSNWTLANGSGGPWTLTLATSSDTPVIQVVNQTTTVTTLLGGSQGFIKSGTGALTLNNAANTFSGGVTLSAGTLNFSSGSLGSNLVSFSANAILGWSAGNTQDISAQLKIEDGVTATFATGTNNIIFGNSIQTGTNGNASITKTGSGTLTLNAAQSYLGTTRINGGRIVLSGGDDRISPTGALTLGQGVASGVLQLGDVSTASAQTFTSALIAGSGAANAIVGGNAANSVLTINNTVANVFAGQLGGAGTHENNLTLTKIGAAALTLSHDANSFTGDVNITGGALIITKSTALGSGPKTITISGTVNAPTLRLDGSGGDLNLAADYSLVTSNDNANNPALLNVAGNNSIAGSISLTAGGFGGGNTRIKVNAGSLSLNGAISPSTSASGTLTVFFDSASGTSGSTTGLLSDNGSVLLAVTKASAGVWSLSGTNTYTGTTSINAGTLSIDSISALGSATSAILIGSTTAGTLEYTGSNQATLARGITVNGNGGATISNAGAATLTLSGAQSRGARPLTYTGGSFIISGRITSTATTSPLIIDNATVRLTHNNNTYISPTVVQNGSTLIVTNTNAASSATGTGSITVDATSTLSGTGYINAGLDNNISILGTLSVGDPSLKTAANLDLITSGQGDIDFGAGSLLALDIFAAAGIGDQSGNASDADQLRLAGTINISPGATLKLLNPNGQTSWANGDTFKLLDWYPLTSVTGSFSVDASQLQLPIGHGLDVTHLYSLGTVTVIVPEPDRLLLLLTSVVAFLHRRKRSS